MIRIYSLRFRRRYNSSYLEFYTYFIIQQRKRSHPIVEKKKTTSVKIWRVVKLVNILFVSRLTLFCFEKKAIFFNKILIHTTCIVKIGTFSFYIVDTITEFLSFARPRFVYRFNFLRLFRCARFSAFLHDEHDVLNIRCVINIIAKLVDTVKMEIRRST